MNQFKMPFNVSYLMYMSLGILMVALLAYTQHVEFEPGMSSKLQQQPSLNTELLQELSDDLAHYNIEHDVDFSHAVLRLTSEELLFASGQADLPEKQQTALQNISLVLEKNLICYANGQQVVANSHCQKPQQVNLKSIIIEGHTDNVPVSVTTSAKDNMELSAKRARAVYEKIVKSTLRDLKNNISETLFTIAAYGDSQPLNHYSQPTPDAKNRRIDIRFVFL